MLIKNWKEMWKSYGVLFPAVVTAILLLVDSTVEHSLIPVEFLPIAVFVSGFLGRIIKQYNLFKDGA